MNWNEWKLGTKLALGAGGLAAVLALLAACGLYTIGAFRDSLEHVAGQSARQLRLAGALNTAVSNMAAGQRGVLLFTFASAPDKVADAKKLFAENSDLARKSLSELQPLIASDEERKTVAHLEGLVSTWISRYGEVARLADSGDPTGGSQSLTREILPLYVSAGQDCRQLLTLTDKGLQQDRRAAQQRAEMSWWVTLALILTGAVGVATSILVTRSVNRDIGRVASEIARGSEHLASASQQVASSSQSLAQGTSEQAATLEQTSSSTSEITSVTRKNADNTRSVASLMAKTSALVDGANRNLAEMVESMKEINGSSEKISRIIRVIDEIAFQTNILALNAAVEAARAGEAGMGFAVVADEVRNLAHRSAQAAKDTAALIEDSIARTSQGGRKLDDVADSIRQITACATRVKTLVDEIEAGSQDQSQGIEQIAASMQQMEQVTQRSAASAEESAAASDELAGQARSLNAIVGRLQALTGDYGAGDTTVGRGSAASNSLAALAESIRKSDACAKLPMPVWRGQASSFPLDDEEAAFRG